ncbi:MAG: endonuclease/exonuclease/phosphatase family protein [Sedimentisphaerales bacterium]|nr:endonuclease/exonuclease/phosphatase family protein [Sedimentisphaerales bacterium]
MNRTARHRLKILSYNIHKGFTAGNSEFVLVQMRDILRHIHPDIVFLQEVLGEHKKHQKKIADWPENSQFEFLADQVWPHYAYGKNSVYTSGHHGNAILSKFAFSEWENLDVSSNRFESRGILHGVIPLPGLANPLHVFCIHLNLLHRGRNMQVKTLCSRIREKVPDECPIVIGGDFNDWYGMTTRILMQSIPTQEIFQSSTGRHARTFPSKKPVLPLDRIYCRGVEVVSAKLLEGKQWQSLSDHLPLYCEVTY